MESLFGWVTIEEQEKEVVKKRGGKNLSTTGKQINIIKKALTSQIIRTGWCMNNTGSTVALETQVNLHKCSSCSVDLSALWLSQHTNQLHCLKYQLLKLSPAEE